MGAASGETALDSHWLITIQIHNNPRDFDCNRENLDWRMASSILLTIRWFRKRLRAALPSLLLKKLDEALRPDIVEGTRNQSMFRREISCSAHGHDDDSSQSSP